MSWRSSVAIASADVADAGQAVEPRAELLDGLELGGPRRHALEVLRGADRDGRLGRERGHGLELVGGPLVRLVVVDVEQAEDLGAVEQGRRARRVEAFLDDGGANVLAARVVAIAVVANSGRRDGDRRGRQRAGRQVAAAGEVASRTGRG